MNAAAQQFDAALRVNEPMSRHTSWRVGGTADMFFTPTSREQLIEFIRMQDDDLPLTWVGLGSNLLVRDGGIRGAVIAISPVMGELTHQGGGLVEAEAGLACAVLARNCVRWEIGPAEFFAGIPGTIGGALAMNAGAFGGETWNNVTAVTVVNRAGEVITRQRDEYDVGYRHARGPVADEWFVAASFQFEPEFDTDMARMRAVVQERKQKQPLGLPSCGSVFRNPEGDHAARLIEACGLKGYRIGGAEVSPKHANFIINTGDATAADIESLIDHVAQTVATEQGVELQREVRIMGEAA